jgi:hypothetical protein
MAVITLGAGCSISSATGCLIRRAAFFTEARFGLALATVRFAAFARAVLRVLPRLAEFPLGSFPRFCTFDPFLRLAMIDPLWLMLRNALTFDQSQTGRIEVVKWWPSEKAQGPACAAGASAHPKTQTERVLIFPGVGRGALPKLYRHQVNSVPPRS